MNRVYYRLLRKNLSQMAIALWLLTSITTLPSIAAEYTVNEDVAPNSQETNNSRSQLDFFRKLIDYYYASWAYWSDENGVDINLNLITKLSKQNYMRIETDARTYSAIWQEL